MSKEFHTDWEVSESDEIKEYLHHTSDQFYDDMDNPELSPRDRKNMRILDNSRVK